MFQKLELDLGWGWDWLACWVTVWLQSIHMGSKEASQVAKRDVLFSLVRSISMICLCLTESRALTHLMLEVAFDIHMATSCIPHVQSFSDNHQSPKPCLPIWGSSWGGVEDHAGWICWSLLVILIPKSGPSLIWALFIPFPQSCSSTSSTLNGHILTISIIFNGLCGSLLQTKNDAASVKSQQRIRLRVWHE